MDKPASAKSNSTMVNGYIEYRQNAFYNQLSPMVKTLMGILEKGLYDGSHGLDYKPTPVQEVDTAAKKYVYHVPPLKLNDPDGILKMLREGRIERGQEKEIKPGYVLKDKYVENLILMFEATHTRIYDRDVKYAASTKGYEKSTMVPREIPSPRGIVEPFKPPNPGVVKRTTFIVGPGGGKDDWRRDMIIKGSPDDGQPKPKSKA